MVILNFLKKGFSPLVATVLLIAFSVAMVSVVINWKGSFVTKNGDICSKIDFSIETLNGIQLCYRPISNNIEVDFIVKNRGDVDIGGMSMFIIGDNGKKIQDLKNINIKTNSLFYAKNLEVQYDLNSYGAINKIYLIPEIEHNGISDICPKLLIEVEKIGKCS